MGWRKWFGVALSVLLSLVLFGALVQAETTLAPVSSKAPSAAVDFYLKIEGAKQGMIKGDRKDGAVTLLNFSHGVTSPRDAGSGLATGKRQHKPLTIVKPIDKSSPLLYNALVSNEPLKSVSVVIAQGMAGKGGAPMPVYTIDLINASIASITQHVNESGMPYEEVSFTYQSIRWTWLDGGIMAEDSWTQTR